jgi:hypothetical protein
MARQMPYTGELGSLQRLVSSLEAKRADLGHLEPARSRESRAARTGGPELHDSRRSLPLITSLEERAPHALPVSTPSSAA